MMSWPPATRTFPSGSKVAVCPAREALIEPVGVHVPVLEAYNSALVPVAEPPATRTFPFVSNVAVKYHWRATLMLPVAVHVPGVDGVSLVATVPVTDLLNPPKARRTPTKQRTKPIKTRGLKKAD